MGADTADTGSSRRYAVKELFPTLQGEGANAGRAAIFLRFAGCNLWSGREQDRAEAVCQFCDTDFVGTDGPGGGTFDAHELASTVRATWLGHMGAEGRPLVVCTGGEPTLQLDEALIDALHAVGFEIAIETNGTRVLPTGLDWICVSPKAGTEVVVRAGHELKVVFPQPGLDLANLSTWPFQHHFVQPMDGPDREGNTAEAVRFCLANPRWRLSVQTHKVIGIR